MKTNTSAGRDGTDARQPSWQRPASNIVSFCSQSSPCGRRGVRGSAGVNGSLLFRLVFEGRWAAAFTPVCQVFDNRVHSTLQSQRLLIDNLSLRQTIPDSSSHPRPQGARRTSAEYPWKQACAGWQPSRGQNQNSLWLWRESTSVLPLSGRFGPQCHFPGARASTVSIASLLSVARIFASVTPVNTVGLSTSLAALAPCQKPAGGTGLRYSGLLLALMQSFA